MSAGSFSPSYSYLGYAGGSGTFLLSGGTVYAGNNVAVGYGGAGTGTFTQTGGALNTYGTGMSIATYGASGSIYSISGGTLNSADMFVSTPSPSAGAGTFKVIGDDATINFKAGGDYAQGALGTLAFDFDAGGISTIALTDGSAALAGTLTVADIGTGVAGTFDVLTAPGGITGDFAAVNLPTGWSYGITDTAGTDTLWVTAVPEPATIGLFGLAGLVVLLIRRTRVR